MATGGSCRLDHRSSPEPMAGYSSKNMSFEQANTAIVLLRLGKRWKKEGETNPSSSDSPRRCANQCMEENNDQEYAYSDQGGGPQQIQDDDEEEFLNECSHKSDAKICRAGTGTMTTASPTTKSSSTPRAGDVNIISYADDILTCSEHAKRVRTYEDDRILKNQHKDDDDMSKISDLTYDHETIGDADVIPCTVNVFHQPSDLFGNLDGTTPVSVLDECAQDFEAALTSCGEDLVLEHRKVSCSSASSSSQSTSSSSSSFSTLLSSDDSCRKSLLSSSTSACARSQLGSLKYDNDASVASTNFTAKSIRLRKNVETRRKLMRQLSSGNRKYGIYLARQEEAVQKMTRVKLERNRRTSLLRKQSWMQSTHTTNRSLDVDNRDGAISQQTRSPNGLEKKLSASRIVTTNWNTFVESTTIQAKATNIKTFRPVSLGERIKKLFPSRTREVLVGGSGLRRMVLFERYHSVPGIVGLMTFCFAHLSAYEAVLSAHAYIFRNINHDAIYVVTFVVGLFLCRISGGVWNWLRDDLYKGLKFDMHNKLRMQDVDARILRKMRRYPQLVKLCNITGTFLCFLAVAHVLHEKLMPAVCYRNVTEYNFPPMIDESIEFYANSMSEGLTSDCGKDSMMQVSFGEWKAQIHPCDKELMCCSGADGLKGYVEEELRMFYRWMGNYYTYKCWIIFYGLNALLSILVLSKIGVGFWDD